MISQGAQYINKIPLKILQKILGVTSNDPLNSNRRSVLGPFEV